jgi:hypothetical protein
MNRRISNIAASLKILHPREPIDVAILLRRARTELDREFATLWFGLKKVE